MNELISFEGDAYVTDEKNRERQETHYHFASDFTQEFQDVSYEWPGVEKSVW